MSKMLMPPRAISGVLNGTPGLSVPLSAGCTLDRSIQDLLHRLGSHECFTQIFVVYAFAIEVTISAA